MRRQDRGARRADVTWGRTYRRLTESHTRVNNAAAPHSPHGPPRGHGPLQRGPSYQDGTVFPEPKTGPGPEFRSEPPPLTTMIFTKTDGR